MSTSTETITERT